MFWTGGLRQETDVLFWLKYTEYIGKKNFLGYSTTWLQGQHQNIGLVDNHKHSIFSGLINKEYLNIKQLVSYLVHMKIGHHLFLVFF